LAASEEHEAWQRVASALRNGSIAGTRSQIAEQSFETHISLVVVYGEVVYKLKKPVTFDYLDYGTRALRKLMCREEIRVNQPLAGDLYRGVYGVREDASGLEVCDEDDTSAIEHLVAMRRLAVEDMLSYRVKNAQVLPQAMHAIGRRIGAYHREAKVLDPPAGQPDTVAALIGRLLATAREGAQTVLDPSRVDALDSFFARWLEVNAHRLQERAAAGWIRDGHGDLRLEHVVVSDPVRVIDAVEFDKSLRANDVLADLAFMVMELQLEEREDLSSALICAWADEVQSVDERLLWSYASVRALARIEVALGRLEQLAPGDFKRSPVVEAAQSLLAVAVKLTWRAREPRAVIFAGLSGSGKTSISSKLAVRWGLERLSSDELRKRQVEVGPKDVAPRYAYERWVSKDVYEQLGREAGREVAAGRSVVVDATFREPHDAQAFVRKFNGSGALTTPIVLACTASEATLRQRVRERSELGGSDAGPEVLDTQLHGYGARPIGISDPLELSTDGSLAGTLKRAEELVISATVS
jgi:uncharacterized protein